MSKLIKSISKIILYILVLITLFALFWCGVCLVHRKHGSVNIKEYPFIESSRELDNPYRGFYNIYGYTVSDENYESHIMKYLHSDENELVLLQINLRNYAQGEISLKGLQNIDVLFSELTQTNKHYIVRFLYDWEGKAIENEPRSIDIILKHMEQMEPFFNKYQGIIFVHQGIFVGDCGEMHGSNYMSNTDMSTLILQLSDIIPPTIYLSVRTPQQWRVVSGLSHTESLHEHKFAYRLGLYNDGMMGTYEDTGTYGAQNKSEVGIFEKWNREEELAFQEGLCKYVPNGGEVIINNSLNDFQNAVDSMKIMHITYLNSSHDKEVLHKWASSIVTEEGCYNGMDGLTYVDRHLGYRLLINDVALHYEYFQDKLTVEVDLQNVGFSPVYKEAEVFFVLKNTGCDDYLSFQISQDIRSLSGGREAEKILKLSKEIALSGYASGKYELYFYIKDVATGRHILLANEQDEELYGYKIGDVYIEPIQNPFVK